MNMWFHVLGLYKRLFEQVNGLSYWSYWSFEHWVDPSGTPVLTGSAPGQLSRMANPATARWE